MLYAQRVSVIDASMENGLYLRSDSFENVLLVKKVPQLFIGSIALFEVELFQTVCCVVCVEHNLSSSAWLLFTAVSAVCHRRRLQETHSSKYLSYSPSLQH